MHEKAKHSVMQAVTEINGGQFFNYHSVPACYMHYNNFFFKLFVE